MCVCLGTLRRGRLQICFVSAARYAVLPHALRLELRRIWLVINGRQRQGRLFHVWSRADDVPSLCGGNGNFFIMAGGGAGAWFFFYLCICARTRSQASETENRLFFFFFNHFLHVSICNSPFRSDASFVWH